MLVGHYSASLLARSVDRNIPMWVLFLAAQAVDLLWIALNLLQVERFSLQPGYTQASPLVLEHMPVSHSLLPGQLWGVAAALTWRALVPGTCWRRAILVGAVVASHWWLDLLVHVPDLPLLWTRHPVGLGLWTDRTLAFALEAVLLVFATAIYWARTRPRDGVGTAGLAGLLGAMVLLLVYSMWGPVPASTASVLGQLLLAYLLLAGAAQWVDTHRRAAFA